MASTILTGRKPGSGRKRYNCGHPDCTMWHSPSTVAGAEEPCPATRLSWLAPPRSFVCPVCDKPFEAQGIASSGRKYCSAPCRANAVAKTCERCGVDFRCSTKDQRFCSQLCRTPGGQPGVKNHLARARANGTLDQYDKSITKKSLGARDNWACKECGIPTPLLPKWDKDNVRRDFPTIGHLKAMVLGGAHSWDNVQLECWRCNNAKSNDEKRQAQALGLRLVPASRERSCEGCGSTFQPIGAQRFCASKCRPNYIPPERRRKPSLRTVERKAKRLAELQERIWGT